MSRLPVKDMPAELCAVLQERGHHPTHEMTFPEALAEWAAYEIGDAFWAYEMLRLQNEFAVDLREQT